MRQTSQKWFSRSILTIILCGSRLLSLAACGDEPTFKLNQWYMWVYDDGSTGIKRDELQAATQLTLETLADARPDDYTNEAVRLYFRNYGPVVRVEAEPVEWNGKEYAGLSTLNGMRFWYDKCLRKSAYVHELLHMLREACQGDPDKAHTDTDMWHDHDGINSYENEVNLQLKECD